ncbi:MAG: thioredoxin domain-containing protein [Anaerolineae bacterium]
METFSSENPEAAVPSENSTVPQLPETPAADASTSAYAEPGTVLVIPRVFINYIVIAIAFFALGAVISGAAVNALFNANSTENKRLLDAAVEQIAKAGGGQQVAGLQPGQTYEVSADDDPIRGVVDAPITIVEFSDFHCAFCGRFAAETLTPLLNNYEGKVRLVYRDYPFQVPGSLTAALAGQCMNDQGKFWEFHDATFANQQALTREQFISYAQQFSIDVDTFTKCLDDQKYLDEVKADVAYAQNLGVNGTPAFFINGTFVSGAQPYDYFAKVIDDELAKLDSSPVTTSSSKSNSATS